MEQIAYKTNGDYPGPKTIVYKYTEDRNTKRNTDYQRLKWCWSKWVTKQTEVSQVQTIILKCKENKGINQNTDYQVLSDAR